MELLCRRWDTAADLAARAARMRHQRFQSFCRLEPLLGAAARAEQGDVERGLPEMLRRFDRASFGHRAAYRPLMLAFIAMAYARAGRWGEALRRAEEGIALADTTTECFYAAELWQLEGELLLERHRR